MYPGNESPARSRIGERADVRGRATSGACRPFGGGATLGAATAPARTNVTLNSTKHGARR